MVFIWSLLRYIYHTTVVAGVSSSGKKKSGFRLNNFFLVLVSKHVTSISHKYFKNLKFLIVGLEILFSFEMLFSVSRLFFKDDGKFRTLELYKTAFLPFCLKDHGTTFQMYSKELLTLPVTLAKIIL